VLESGSLKEAESSIRQAASALDRAAQKGAMHRNKAARTKSRLMKRLNQAKASASG
jgi:small subunit ribosomal protein S20